MKIVNGDGDPVVCARCKKELTTDMELEYSQEATEIFCSPSCATDFYYSYMDSRQIEDGEGLEELGYSVKKGEYDEDKI